jgi:DNA invertase Pin-like site-specific DNA recombinase
VTARLILAALQPTGTDPEPGIFFTASNGRLVFAELERDFIRRRTREALAVRRDHGGVLGGPRSTPDDVVARVVRERTEGKTAYAIARDLNKDAVPTAQGARAWSQATVRALLMREGVR